MTLLEYPEYEEEKAVYAGILAIFVALLIMFGFVVMAFREDREEQQKTK